MAWAVEAFVHICARASVTGESGFAVTLCTGGCIGAGGVWRAGVREAVVHFLAVGSVSGVPGVAGARVASVPSGCDHRAACVRVTRFEVARIDVTARSGSVRDESTSGQSGCACARERSHQVGARRTRIAHAVVALVQVGTCEAVA